MKYLIATLLIAALVGFVFGVILCFYGQLGWAVVYSFLAVMLVLLAGHFDITRRVQGLEQGRPEPIERVEPA